jgi:hypothetical protein
MKSLPLWSLTLVLTVGNITGCSRTSGKSSDAAGVNLASREVAENRLPKPSPCVKWDDESTRSIKPLRKTKGASVGRYQHKSLQAKAENPTHI